jgi:hypothetical protein
LAQRFVGQVHEDCTLQTLCRSPTNFARGVVATDGRSKKCFTISRDGLSLACVGVHQRFDDLTMVSPTAFASF